MNNSKLFSKLFLYVIFFTAGWWLLKLPLQHFADYLLYNGKTAECIPVSFNINTPHMVRIAIFNLVFFCGYGALYYYREKIETRLFCLLGGLILPASGAIMPSLLSGHTPLFIDFYLIPCFCLFIAIAKTQQNRPKKLLFEISWWLLLLIFVFKEIQNSNINSYLLECSRLLLPTFIGVTINTFVFIVLPRSAMKTI